MHKLVCLSLVLFLVPFTTAEPLEVEATTTVEPSNEILDWAHEISSIFENMAPEDWLAFDASHALVERLESGAQMQEKGLIGFGGADGGEMDGKGLVILVTQEPDNAPVYELVKGKEVLNTIDDDEFYFVLPDNNGNGVNELATLTFSFGFSFGGGFDSYRVYFEIELLTKDALTGEPAGELRATGESIGETTTSPTLQKTTTVRTEALTISTLGESVRFFSEEDIVYEHPMIDELGVEIGDSRLETSGSFDFEQTVDGETYERSGDAYATISGVHDLNGNNVDDLVLTVYGKEITTQSHLAGILDGAPQTEIIDGYREIIDGLDLEHIMDLPLESVYTYVRGPVDAGVVAVDFDTGFSYKWHGLEPLPEGATMLPKSNQAGAAFVDADNDGLRDWIVADVRIVNEDGFTYVDEITKVSFLLQDGSVVWETEEDEDVGINAFNPLGSLWDLGTSEDALIFVTEDEETEMETIRFTNPTASRTYYSIHLNENQSLQLVGSVDDVGVVDFFKVTTTETDDDYMKSVEAIAGQSGRTMWSRDLYTSKDRYFVGADTGHNVGGTKVNDLIISQGPYADIVCGQNGCSYVTDETGHRRVVVYDGASGSELERWEHGANITEPAVKGAKQTSYGRSIAKETPAPLGLLPLAALALLARKKQA